MKVPDEREDYIDGRCDGTPIEARDKVLQDIDPGTGQPMEKVF
jgi:hypothetical protein